MKQPIKRETITNHFTAMHTEPMKLNSHPFSGRNFQGFQSQEEHNESLITLTSNDEMPVGNKKESKNDLRKYIKMVGLILIHSIDNEFLMSLKYSIK